MNELDAMMENVYRGLMTIDAARAEMGLEPWDTPETRDLIAWTDLSAEHIRKAITLPKVLAPRENPERLVELYETYCADLSDWDRRDAMTITMLKEKLGL